MHYHSPIGVERSLRRRRSGGVFHRSVERSLVYDPSDMEATLAHRGSPNPWNGGRRDLGIAKALPAEIL